MERELFVTLLEALRTLSDAGGRPAKCRYADAQVVVVLLWATLHDRPISWACRREHWPWHDRTRPLPSGSTMSRRLRTPGVRTRLLLVLAALAVPAAPGVLILDAKPLPVSGHSADPDAGYGRGAGGMGRGYKLHAITDTAGNVLVFEVLALSTSEQAAARMLLARLPVLPGGLLLADGNYDSSELYDLAAARGLQLLASRRYQHAKGLGHHRHSPRRLEGLRLLAERPELHRPRRLIEGHFGTLGNVIGGLAPLPHSVRRRHRVGRWVTAKLIIDAPHRRRRHAA